MNILEEIIQSKYSEVTERKAITSATKLEKLPLFERKTLSLKEALLNSQHHGIIAEFKRKSPSKGQFIGQLAVEDITKGYVNAGAAALSVLTDGNYFGGSLADLQAARFTNNVPVLRKDFMVDEYQILEAKAYGADVILLIAAGIDSALLNRLAKFAKSLGLETLLEVREKEELEGNLSEYIDVVGINNRNLKDFKVDIQISIETSEHIPSQFVKISESGISQAEVIHKLENHGFKGFLMGEAFMQTVDPIASIQKFIQSI